MNFLLHDLLFPEALAAVSPGYRILVGDNRESMKTLPDKCIQTCVTSPPYFGLRDYGVEGQLGLEATPDEFCAALVEVFREVRRVLKDDGTVWLNLGDSYATTHTGSMGRGERAANFNFAESRLDGQGKGNRQEKKIPEGLKNKDLIGIPWRVAFALQADGWYLRQDIIWSKPNPMPESVRDRCTKAHEYVFLLSKSPKYYFDSEAIRNPPSEALLKQVAEGYAGTDTKDFGANGAQSASGTKGRIIEGARKKIDKMRGHERTNEDFRDKWDGMTKAEQQALGSNKRSVWTVATKPFKGAHFATFPAALIEPCILAGSRPGDLVLDPFGGSGTVAEVSLKHGREAVLCELNPAYAEIAHNRIRNALQA